MSVSSTNNVVILNADGSTHSFTFNFKIFAASDLKVIVRSSAGVETDQTLNSQYIIPDSSVDNASGGNILFKFNTGTSSDAHFSSTDFRPANGSKVILRQNIPLTQTLDLVNNDPFDAETLESSLDRIVLQVQSVKEAVDRSFKFSRSNLLDSSGSQIGSTYPEIEEDTTARANKVLSFDSTGTPIATQEIGTLKGDWAASTAYQERDIVKDTSTSNHFIVNSAHTSSGSQPLTTNTNASKYTAITNFSGATLSPGQLVVDNITIDGNTISTTNSNGDLILTPNGTGNLHVDGEIKVEGNDASEATNFVTISPSSTGGDDIFLEGVNAAIAFYDTSTNTVPRYGQGSILFYGKNASGNFVQVGSVEGYQSDATDSSVDGGIRFTGTSNNSTAEHASISGLSALLIDGLNSRFGGTVTIEDKLIMADVTSGKILIADGASYEEQAVSGDITINSSGVTAISSGVIVNADISGSAAIADSKLATITTADKVSGAAIQIDGATDGTSITVADADKLLIDDGGTTKYINASQLNTYISAAASSVAADNITAGDAAVTLTTTSGNITIDAQASNSNIILKGTDGSTDTTYLTISGGDAGAATFNSTVTATGFIIGSANINENDLEAIDGITAGTGAASKAVVLDSSSNVNNIGTISATNLNISNDVDVDGTLEADAITINGTAISSVLSPVAGHASIVTVGALDSGSITSGFGNINNGSSTITTTGAITGGAVNIGTTGSLSNNSGTFLIDANTNLNFRGGTQTFDNADGSVEYMRLTSTGLGVGTTANAPLAILSKSSSYEGLELVTPASDGSGEFHIGVHQSGSSSGRGLQFRRGGSDGMDTLSMAIDASGNVGIGTPSPAASFHVSGDNPRARFTDTPNSVNFDIFMDDDNATVGTQTNHSLKFMTNDTERLRIFNSGTVALRSQTNLFFYNGNNDNYSKILNGSNASGNTLDFYTNALAMAIDINGTLLVGRTADGDSTAGAMIRGSGFIQSTRDGNLAADFNRLSSDGDIVRFQRASTPVGTISVANSGGNFLVKSVGDAYLTTSTSDGSDDHFAALDGGNGAGSTSRGAFIGAYGNEHSSFGGDALVMTGASGAVKFLTGSNADERMRITSSGNVGIGSSNSEEYPLFIKGSNISSGGGLAALCILDDGTSYNGTNPGGGITFRGKFNNSGSTTNFATVQGIKENTTDGNYATALRFTTRANGGNLTEKMRIDSSGNVGIGSVPTDFAADADNLVVSGSGATGITIDGTSTTSSNIYFADGPTGAEAYRGYFIYDHPNDNLRIGVSANDRMLLFGNGTIRNGYAGSAHGVIDISVGNSSASYIFDFIDENGIRRMVIYPDGDIQNADNSYGAFSDEKLKENISDASSQWDDIKALKIRKYSLKSDKLSSANKLGVIAQELEASGMSGLVTESPDATNDNPDIDTTTKSVKYSILYMKAVKALQEAMTRIETLEAKVAKLEGA